MAQWSVRKMFSLSGLDSYDDTSNRSLMSTKWTTLIAKHTSYHLPVYLSRSSWSTVLIRLNRKPFVVVAMHKQIAAANKVFIIVVVFTYWKIKDDFLIFLSEVLSEEDLLKWWWFLVEIFCSLYRLRRCCCLCNLT